MHTYGSGGGGYSGISISVPSATMAASSPRGYSTGVIEDETLDELIRISEQQGQVGVYPRGQGSIAQNLYSENLRYIRDHPPVVTTEGEENDDGIGINDILDAIFYASAIASIVPVAPLAIGGRIGLLASSAGRYASIGNYRAAARNLGQINRTVDRGTRQYRAYSQKLRKKKTAGKARIRKV